MANLQEQLRLLEQIEHSEKYSCFRAALNKALPNEGEEINFEKWGKGIEKFQNDNKEVLLAMVNHG